MLAPCCACAYSPFYYSVLFDEFARVSLSVLCRITRLGVFCGPYLCVVKLPKVSISPSFTPFLLLFVFFFSRALFFPVPPKRTSEETPACSPSYDRLEVTRTFRIPQSHRKFSGHPEALLPPRQFKKCSATSCPPSRACQVSIASPPVPTLSIGHI